MKTRIALGIIAAAALLVGALETPAHSDEVAKGYGTLAGATLACPDIARFVENVATSTDLDAMEEASRAQSADFQAGIKSAFAVAGDQGCDALKSILLTALSK